ncbi:MAG: gas vesicle protein [Actinomycetota bacterium]|nr:gas vesicle protein [Actinomycetota bacterium]
MATPKKTTAKKTTAKKTTAKKSRARGTSKQSSSSGSAREKAPAEKAAAKRTPAKKTTAKSAPAKKAAAKAASDGSRTSASVQSGTQIAAEAARQLLDLTAKEPESISGLERRDGGWTVQVDVLELRRIPNTTDILASYEVQTDEKGELMGYRRVRRYVRGGAGEE